MALVETYNVFFMGKYSQGRLMKVALISPFWDTANPYPPLGLAYLGAVMEKEGHIARIFDMTLESEMPFEKKMEEIIAFSPEIAGISAMSHTYANALDIARFLKSKLGISIVLGGPHPTIMPEVALRNEYIDFVVIGEGEETFLKMCRNFQKRDFHGIDGLCYKENEKLIIQPKNQFIGDLDLLPLPARHLLMLDNYGLKDDFGNRMATIISSRGCPYRCTYCYKGLFGRTYRQRSPKNIIEEIKFCINNFDYKSFYFIDDLFTLDIKRIEELTDAIRKENLDIRWQCLARVSNATSRMFELMKEAGCYKVHFGIESGNQYILNEAKKGITLEQVRKAVKYCKRAGIRTKGYFMIGMPKDTVSSMQDTINFAKELRLDDVMFSITTPFPGTQLWETIDKEKIGSLSEAFYFSCNSDKVTIFYNLSDATNTEIIEKSKEAGRITEELEIKKFCEKNFGKKIGYLAWELSRVPVFKKIGKNILGNIGYNI